MDQLEALHREMATKGPDTRASAFKRLQKEVSGYDPTLLAGALAGLALLPNNASSQLRLECLIDVVASLGGAGNAIPSNHRLQQLCNGSLARQLVAPLEDPSEYPVTEPLAFADRVYTVFTGQCEEIVFVSERLFEAFDELADVNELDAFTDAVGLIRAILALEDAIARRAGFGSGVSPRGDQLEVPRASSAQLAEPVLWQAQEIEDLCKAVSASPDALGPLVTKMGQVPPLALSDDGPSSFAPLLRANEGTYVVRAGQLLNALGRHLREVAAEAGFGSELALRYAGNIHDSVVESALRMGADILPLDIEPSDIPCLFESLFRTDHDSAMLFLTVGESPEESTLSTDLFPSESLRSALNERAGTVLAAVRSRAFTNVLVCVVPAVLPGRGYLMHEVAEVEATESIALTAPALEAIAFSERDPLALHRFARSVREFRANTEVVSFNPLDLFATYRRHAHSFYLDDNRRYRGVSLEPGLGLPLRLEMLGKQRLQSAIGPRSELEIEVVSTSAEGLPAYRPRKLFPQPLRLVRFPGQDVWVVLQNPYLELGAGLARFGDQLADAVAYWVWRIGSVVFDGKTSGFSPATVFVEMESIEEWGRSETPSSKGHRDIRYNVDAATSSMGIYLASSWQGALAQPQNYAERYLAWVLIEGLMELVTPGDLSKERIASALNEAAPIGQRRMLVVMQSDTTSLLGDDAGLPSWRAVSEWDRGRVRDDLAVAYQASGFVAGPAGDADDQNKLIQFAVANFLGTLADRVSQLSPVGLLDDLLRREESLILEVGRVELTIPTRLACFGDVIDVASQVAKETRDITQASIAHRFLVEYVTARPPTGSLSLSNARYDDLLALASSIAEGGLNSDITHYRLDDLQARILPSGRLGIAAGRYEAATERWNGGMNRRHIEWSQEGFAAHWASPPESSGPPEPWDAAFLAEFGYSMIELREVLDELLDLASDGAGSVAGWPRQDLVLELARRTRRDPQVPDRILSRLTLGPRANFVKPDGFAREEIYPWRFNRELSLVRRPIVARGDDLLWGRRGTVFAVRNLLALIGSGRFKATSPKMASLMSGLTSRQGQGFEDEVAALVRGLGFEVRQRVKKLGSRRLMDDGNDLGDIDVLAMDVPANRIWAIECKALAFARTPWELASEMGDFSDPEHGIPVRHRRRVDWLRRHQAELATFIGQPDLKGWRIEPAIVVEIDLLTFHLHETGMPVSDPPGLPTVLLKGL